MVHKWCLQPLFQNRLHGGDFMFAAATVTSGNNFQKITLLAKALNLPILSISTFYKIQRTYVVPGIDQFWLQCQQEA
jgi:hypothetical protein